MSKTIADKLQIKSGFKLLAINAPIDFKQTLANSIPGNVNFVSKNVRCDQVHWFVLNKKQLENETAGIMKLLKQTMTVWVYYPKGSSKIQTDLTRDKGWDCLLAKSDKLTWISLISFDATWSVFGFRPKTLADKKKDSQPKQEREILKWINPTTKEVKLPKDLIAAFQKNKKLFDYFSGLAFSHRKEYVEWIVTAKKEETRQKRIEGSLERLAKQWKNPRNI